MLSYQLPTTYDLLVPNNKKRYKIKPLEELKARLASTKSLLDTHYVDQSFDKYWKECDPFKNERKIIAQLGNTENITNAWLKCYEIIQYYGLIPNNLDHGNLESNKLDSNKPDSGKPESKTSADTSNQFIHFDNAAFPGTFILSTHHYVITKTKLGSNYKWYASSLLDKNSKHLTDEYKLYNKYPASWLMDDKHDGNVLSRINQQYFCDRLGASVDLYTSDLGFDTTSDYNNQEINHIKPNVGQILSGLLTLKKGGHMVTKQYTIFEPVSICVLYMLLHFFDKVFICKPATSREANSEIYIVCKSFRGGAYYSHPYCQAMFAIIESDQLIPPFDFVDIDKSFVKLLLSIVRKITVRQIEKIKTDIDTSVLAMKNIVANEHPMDNPIIIEYVTKFNVLLEEWYRDRVILPIEYKDKL